MMVWIHPVEGGYAIADDGGWVPGTWATQGDAMRAAWLMRWHGTVKQEQAEAEKVGA